MQGRAEAKKAGLLLKAHNIEFDIVYTSWLSRAIETAWIVLDELDSLWLPILKTWRLNERFVLGILHEVIPFFFFIFNGRTHFSIECMALSQGFRSR